MTTLGWETLCWGIFGLVWLAGALYNRFRAPRVQCRGSGWLVSSLVVLVPLWLILALVPGPVWSVVTLRSRLLWDLGLGILLLSTAFTLWARWVLGTMWSSAPTVREGHRLQTGGPYRITRHPIYTGILGMILGTTLMHGVGPILPYLLLALAVFAWKMRAEERLMRQTFGDEYDRYRQRVPGLIPGLKRFWR